MCLAVALLVRPFAAVPVLAVVSSAVAALLAAVFFFWVSKKSFVLKQVNLARKKPLGPWFYPMAKYLFCGVTLLVLILGAALGGIG